MLDLFRKKEQRREPAKEEQKKAEIYAVSELGVARYEIEHRVLRDLFFEDPAPMLSMLVNNEGAYGVFDQCFKMAKAANPYKKSDFSVTSGKIDDDHIMVSLELPEPEYTPLCYRIYFVCRSDFTAPAMFTIERGVTDGFICGWNSKGDHLNFSKLKDPARKENPGLMRAMEVNIILDLYKEQSKGTL